MTFNALPSAFHRISNWGATAFPSTFQRVCIRNCDVGHINPNGYMQFILSLNIRRLPRTAEAQTIGDDYEHETNDR
jgi:hypothetical protein